MKKCILLSIILCSSLLFAIKIDRVILTTYENHTNLKFWPIVAKVWKYHLGIEPTLALITNNKFISVDESVGQVIKFKPIKKVSPIVQAQVLKLLLPSQFEEDVCIISDIDIIPISKKFFFSDLAVYGDEKFILIRNTCRYFSDTFPFCYIIAKGITFKEIFAGNAKNISSIIQKWANIQPNINVTERLLYYKIRDWEFYKTRFVYCHPKSFRRIGRNNWYYDKDLLLQSCRLDINFFSKLFCYIDCQLPGPYEYYKEQIDQLLKDLSIELKAVIYEQKLKPHL